MSLISSKYINNALSFEEYMQLTKDQVAHGITSGPNQTPSLIEYTKLNLKRMERLLKSYQPQAQSVSAIRQINQPVIWLVLTETWCGDAAQNIPVFHKLALENKRIRLCFLFRDENLEIMDGYLTRGTRSIPKLIALDKNMNELFNFGPRPTLVQERFYELKNSGMPHDEYIVEIHKLYTTLAGIETEKELVALSTSALGLHSR